MPELRQPKVSVLIPTYNYARYLPQAIESILEQTFSDFELIISDDASTDESESIIRSYAARDDRIRFRVQSPNLGMVANWSWCLEQANGAYIKYMFADDLLLRPDALAQLVQMIESRPGVTLASSARTVIDEHSKPIETRDDFGASGIFDGREAISWSLRSNCNVFGEPSAALFRKDDAKRGFDRSYAQIVDWELWIHILQRGCFAYTTEPLCGFRVHDLQQTQVNRKATGAVGEHPRLLRQYSDYLVFRPEYRREAFERMYRLRRKRFPEPYDLEIAALLEHALGSSYYPHWLRYKLVRPWLGARRFWCKQVLGREPAKSFPHPRRIMPIASGRGDV